MVVSNIAYQAASALVDDLGGFLFCFAMTLT